MKSQNILDGIPDVLDEELFHVLAQKGAVKIQRIVSKGHSSPKSGWYDQEQDEWVIILQGSAMVTFEGNSEERLETGSYLNIPAHTKHKVSWTSPDIETVWLAIHY